MVFQLIKKHFVQNKVVFSVFVLCQIVSLIMVLFVFNLIQIREDLRQLSFLPYRTVIVNFPHNESPIEKINQLLKDSSLLKNTQSIDREVSLDNRYITILLYADQIEKRYVVEAGRHITAEELQNQSRVAVVNPRFWGESVRVGDEIELLGQKYQVVGLSTVADFKHAEIPYREELAGHLNGVQCLQNPRLSDKSQTEYLTRLEELFPDSSVSKLMNTPKESFQITSEDVLILLSLILVNLNFAMIYYYILNKDKKTYSIFRMCGCSPRRGTLLLLGEVGALCVASFFISALLFHFVGPTIFSFMESSIVYTFSIRTTIRAFLAYAVALAVIFIPIMLRYNRHSAYELYNGETDL